MCGIITMDFLRGEEIALSLNLRSDYVVSTWDSGWSAPLSWRSQWAVNRWIDSRDLRDRVTKVKEGKWDGLPK
jgi:hypothetical protein